ncbi:MAG: oligosaccharide flippase family protein [Isosphaeraceae bacterium]|nr:oligosaccharide flippase family protein [Isosphaeraceae bacterium]
MATNFAALSVAEVTCRGISVAVTLYLAQALGATGFGRIEFAFNIVFWLVLLVREGLEVIAAREIARHPQLIRPLVNHVLAVRSVLALGLLAGLVTVGMISLSHAVDRAVLALYGLMLLTTALGLDFVFRGLERVGIVAISLVVRTSLYALGVALWVSDASRIVWVPGCLVAGEACGIALVWGRYVRKFGLPRPTLRGSRSLRVFLRRGKPVYLIQVSQALIGSVDLLVVGLLSRWADVGLYSAPHRMVTAVLTFGMIFQQVVFPSLARSWRDTPAACRRSLDALVRVLMLGLVPLAVGATVLAGPLMRYLFHTEYSGAALLLAVGVWRAPLLTLAFLYQTTLIALNREAVGVRLLMAGAIGSAPLVAALRLAFGLLGGVVAILLTGLALVAAGYGRLAHEGRQPSWHHHLGHPIAASMAMVPPCLLLVRFHVLAAAAGGVVVYLLALAALGGLRREDLRTILGREPVGPLGGR